MKNAYILIIGCSLIVCSLYCKYLSSNTNSINNITPINNEIINNIYYDDYDNVKILAQKNKQKILLIFGSSWCPYCKKLKEDQNYIEGFKQYLVCHIDIDKDKSLKNKYNIKSLPTSIILDFQGKQIDKKTGYSKQQYENWLKQK